MKNGQTFIFQWLGVYPISKGDYNWADINHGIVSRIFGDMLNQKTLNDYN